MENDEMQKKKAQESLCDSLEQVAEDIDSVQKESPKIQDKGKASKEPLVQDSSLERHTLDVESNMVGRDDQRKRLLAELTKYGGSSGELKVIPIVGMGGIGKTTLAKAVYNDASVQSHFDVRAWATISQQHNVKEILLSLLRSTKGDKFGVDGEAELAAMLKKSLTRRRYLIVLDDMWKSEAWNDVRLCFPSENNGSRILLTTRNTEVACSDGIENLSLHMGFMDPDESWKLFRSAAFANEALLPEFETIGKQIVDKCHGLPLTVVVAAGVLSKSKRTIEDWKTVAEDVMSFVTNDPDEQCLHVLALSYNHLPSHLKAYLLYFGIFPEDREISVKRLVRLWMAEEYMKSDKDLEEVAEKCLQELIDRCLILVTKKSLDETKIRSCKVHDLIYELCLREAQSQNVYVMKDILFNDLHNMKPFFRHIYHGSYRALLTPGRDDDNNLWKRTHSVFFLCNFYSSTPTLELEFSHFNSLRILDLSPIRIDIFPPQILLLIWLRYLELKGDFDIPPEICTLRDLQTFIVGGHRSANTIFPKQIWELIKLKHLILDLIYLPNPPSVSVDEEQYLVFPNIQTISGLCPSCCTKEVISGIQNVKRLRISGDKDNYGRAQESRLFDNLVHLHQLEALTFRHSIQRVSFKISPVIIPSAKAFPAMLKKLKFWGTHLSWEDLNIIGELPNLELLKLMLNACIGKEWCPIAGGFNQLKVLLLENNQLKHWKATDDNFRVLERLVIRSCHRLNELPIVFAEINSLQLIELNDCMLKHEASAARIQQEQEDLGNKPVDVHISNTFSPSASNIITELSFTETVTSSNYEEWKQYLKRILGPMNMDIALTEQKPAEPTRQSTPQEVSKHAKWLESNRRGLMLMKTSIPDHIKDAIKDDGYANDYLSAIGQKLIEYDNSEKAASNINTELSFVETVTSSNYEEWKQSLKKSLR